MLAETQKSFSQIVQTQSATCTQFWHQETLQLYGSNFCISHENNPGGWIEAKNYLNRHLSWFTTKLENSGMADVKFKHTTSQLQMKNSFKTKEFLRFGMF